MAEPAMRVALLARPGTARDRLQAALQEAGAEIVHVADPNESDASSLADAGAQAVLVALEPSVEDALERFDAMLSDPAMIVIFDEAELAAKREGWDAARWVRHLAAKLHRHDDVLPPGSEIEAHLALEPGRLSLYQRPEGDGDLSGVAGEAMTLADGVPRDQLDIRGAVGRTRAPRGTGAVHGCVVAGCAGDRRAPPRPPNPRSFPPPPPRPGRFAIPKWYLAYPPRSLLLPIHSSSLPAVVPFPKSGGPLILGVSLFSFPALSSEFSPLHVC